MRAFLKALGFLFGLVLAAAPAFAGMGMSAGTGAHTHSDANTGGGTLALGGTLSSTKTCASGYARITPNLCWVGGAAFTLLARDICTAIVVPSADAKALVYSLRTEPRAAGAVAVRQTMVLAYDDVACAGTLMASQQSTQYEEVSKSAGTALGDEISQHVAPVLTGNPRLRMQDDAGNNGVGWYRIMGYYD